MKCQKCDNKAVINLQYTTLCKKHFIQYYERKVKRTASKVLSKKEKVGVGVSGGKDSLALLYVLHKLGYNTIPILIDEGIRRYRKKTVPYAGKLCKQLGL